MDFGLGLILSFTDNASTGINSAVQSLNGLTGIANSASRSLSSLADTALLSATASSANMIGNSLVNMGSKFTSLFTSLTAKAKSLGSEYETFGNTLKALGGNYQRDIKKLFDFSTHSSLEVGEVKDFMFTLQAQGINAFDSIRGSISGTRQEMLAWLTDLRSSRMDVPAQRFKLAIQNYIGSGEKKMMRTVFDMGDIEDIIGRKAGDTAEKRMQDIVDMVEKKGLTGLADKLSNTWEGVASNIDDAFSRIFYSVANDGAVFEKLKGSFKSLANVIIKLPSEDLEVLGRTIGDSINTIIDPLTRATKVVSKFLKQVINVAKTNPVMVKTGIILTTIAGGMLILSGVTMKAIGGIANFCLVLKLLETSTGSVARVFSSGMRSMLSAIGPLALSISLLYLLIRSDFGGIASTISGFVDHLHSSMVAAKNYVDGSFVDMVNCINRLKSTDNFWGNITFGLMQIYGSIKFVVEAWNNYTLSEDSFQKAIQLGILPLIEAVLDLKYRFNLFKRGFIAGWQSISRTAKEELAKLTSAIQGTPLDGLTDRVTSFLQIFSSTDADRWYRFGESLANTTFKAVALSVALMAFNKVIKVFSGILAVARPLIGLIMANPLVAVIGALIGVFVLLYNKVKPFRDLVNNTISTIEKLVTKVSGKIKSDFINGLENVAPLADKIKEKFRAITDTIGGNLKGIPQDVARIMEAFSNSNSISDFSNRLASLSISGFDSSLTEPLIIGIMNVLPWISRLYLAFSDLGNSVLGVFLSLGKSTLPLLGNSIKFITGVLSTIVSLVTSLGLSVMNLLPTALGLLATIGNLVSGIIVPLVSKLISLAVPFILRLIEHIRVLASSVLPIISNVIDYVGKAINDLARVLIPVVNNIINALMPIVSSILGIISTAVGKLVPIIKSIFSVIANTIKALVAFASPILGIIAQIAQVAVQVLAPIFDVVVKAVGAVINAILGILQVIMSVSASASGIITGIIQFIMSAVNMVIQIFMGIISPVIGALTIISTTVGAVFGGIISIIYSVWDGIVTAFSGAVEFFSSVFQSIFEVVSGVFNKIAEVFTNIWNGITTSFNTIGDVVGGGIRSAINTVLGGAVNIVNKFFKGINSCIGAINSIPGVSISKLNMLQVPQFAEGGVVSKPTLGIFGEAGQEAVVPLQNNTEWTSKVAGLLAGAFNTSSDPVMGQLISVLAQLVNVLSYSVNGGNTERFAPVSINNPDSIGTTNTVTNISNTDSSNSMVKSEKVDASVHFESGSIVINANNASELDAEKFAIKLMGIIKRKQELKEMLNYS